MTALIENRSKLIALSAIVAVAGAAILYAVWRDANRLDYAVDSAKYLKGVSTSLPTIDVTVPASPPFMPRSSIVESVGFGPLPRAPLPTDQEGPPRPAISWSTPRPVFALPEIQTPPDLKNLTGLDKLPSLSGLAPGTSFPMPALSSEPSGTTFRLILPGATPTGAIDSPAGLPGSLPGGVLGAAGGLLPKR
jgi:hypothetical protein